MKEGRQDRDSASTLKLMSRFMKGSTGFFVVSFLLLIIDLASYILPPFFQQVYTDNVITRKNPEWFGPLMFFYIMLFVLELATWLLVSPLRKRHFSKLNILAN